MQTECCLYVPAKLLRSSIHGRRTATPAASAGQQLSVLDAQLVFRVQTTFIAQHVVNIKSTTLHKTPCNLTQTVGMLS